MQQKPDQGMTPAEELFHLLHLTDAGERERLQRLTAGFGQIVGPTDSDPIEIGQLDCVTGGWEEATSAELE